MLRFLCYLYIFSLFIASLGQTSAQNVILHTNGFEQPVFSEAKLKGQAGWLEAGQPDGAIGYIQKRMVRTGEQAVGLDRLDVDHRFGVPV